MNNGKKVALRDYLEQYEFSEYPVKHVQHMLEDLICELVRNSNRHFATNIESPNKNLFKTRMMSVGSINVTNPELNTVMQEACKQLSLQKGEEIKPCFYNDMEIVENNTNQLVGSEFWYSDRTYNGTIFRFETVIFHPADVTKGRVTCGMKSRLFVGKGLKVKQLTLTLVDNLDTILEQARISYINFISNIKDEIKYEQYPRMNGGMVYPQMKGDM